MADLNLMCMLASQLDLQTVVGGFRGGSFKMFVIFVLPGGKLLLEESGGGLLPYPHSKHMHARPSVHVYGEGFVGRQTRIWPKAVWNVWPALASY